MARRDGQALPRTPAALARDGDAAEKLLLGSVLRRPAEAMDEAAGIIREEDLRQHPHQIIWRGMRTLYQSGRPIDVEELFKLLLAKGWADDAGGASYLGELLTLEPTGIAARDYALQVRSFANLRRLAAEALRIAQEAEEARAPAQEILARAEAAIFGLAEHGAQGRARPVRELVGEAFVRLDERCRRDRPVSGVPSGLTRLDEVTTGFQPGELVIVGARPGVGKSALALAVAHHAAAEGHPVLLSSLEMSGAEITDRLLARAGGVNVTALRTGSVTTCEARRLSGLGPVIEGLPLFVDDAASQSVMHILSEARRLKRRSGLKVVMIDYLQLVEPENRRNHRYEQVAQISRRLKFLAKELEVPVIALAQVSRACEDRAGGKPRLSDLRESGDIEQNADVVLLLSRKDDVYLEVEVAKNRNGPCGEITVRFDRATMRIADDLPEGF
jgi:replicative DNA helicase